MMYERNIQYIMLQTYLHHALFSILGYNDLSCFKMFNYGQTNFVYGLNTNSTITIHLH